MNNIPSWLYANHRFFQLLCYFLFINIFFHLICWLHARCFCILNNKHSFYVSFQRVVLAMKISFVFFGAGVTTIISSSSSRLSISTALVHFFHPDCVFISLVLFVCPSRNTSPFFHFPSWNKLLTVCSNPFSLQA